MKAVPKRAYTPEFRDSAVKQVLEGGRSIASVARSLEMSSKSLANWVYRARFKALLSGDLPADALKALLAHFPATAELYENLNYAHAGLVCAPLDQSIEAKRMAQRAIERWRRLQA